jgi:PDDEXK-like domain of unknown function (DUF3799)
MQPGIYDNIPDDEYHASPGISNTGLVIIANKTPAHYIAYRDEPREATPALTDGKRIHRIVLEPDRFESEYAVMPKFDMRRTVDKALAEAWARDNEGKTGIAQPDFDTLCRIRDAVHQHPDAIALLTGGKAERSVYAQDPITGVLVRSRPDYDSGWLADLKSTTDCSEDAFKGSAFKYGYHQQAAFYLDTYEWATGQRPDYFHFIAVEKVPPFAVKVYTASPSFISRGRDAYRRALDIYADCVATDRWPAYPAGVTSLDLPVWAENMLQAEDNDEIEGISYV